MKHAARAVVLVAASLSAPLSGAEPERPRVDLAPVESLAPGERVERIGLAAALEEARSAAPGPVLARALRVEADAAHDRTFEQLLPGISLEGVRRHTDGAVQATLGDVLDADYSTAQLEGSLHLDLKIANLRAEQAARSRLTAASANVDEAGRLSAATVVELYLGVQRGRARLAAADAAQREAEESASVQGARFHAGSALKADWLRQQARAAETRLAVVAARLESRILSLRLARALGRDPEVLLVPEEDDLTPPPTGGAGAVPASMLAAAEQARPDLAVARAQLEAETRELRAVEDAALWPTLTLDVRKGFLGQNASDAQARTVYGAWLKWDVFDTRGGSLLSRRAEARARVGRRTAELADLQRQVKAELLGALARNALSRQAFEAAAAGEAAAREALEVRRVRERSGLESGLDILEAERDLARARFAVADTVADLALSGYLVRLAQGDTLLAPPSP